MKIVSWNVNGIRSCLNKGFLESVKKLGADVLCLQETKAQKEQVELELPGYLSYWNSAVRKGYSGTAVFTHEEPLSVTYGIDRAEHDSEGRIITLEFADFFVVNCYTPNARDGLVRLPYRMAWEDALRGYLVGLAEKKGVVYCGDLNVAHKEIDLARPKQNVNNPGFTPQEREKLSALLDSGFADSFRLLYPEKADAYSWWSYRMNARARNVGWRIDYCVVSQNLAAQVKEASIHADILGSDHCPVGVELDASDTR
ncbi:MAG: exodeoxyribonuclease III [Oscillospiraceae bacterium]|nr:exodeoxyribonuclease III [Oscillospiraceae bacterium]